MNVKRLVLKTIECNFGILVERLGRSRGTRRVGGELEKTEEKITFSMKELLLGVGVGGVSARAGPGPYRVLYGGKKHL